MKDPVRKADPPAPGEDTRQRLVEAGLELFGRHGYDGVTTRALAEAAGVNLAAIPYHFGGKEGVYAAVAEHVLATCGADMLKVVAEVFPDDAAPADRHEAVERLKTLLNGVLHEITRSPARALYGSFIVREQLQPGAAFETLYERLFCHVHGSVAKLVGAICGEPADAPRTIMRAHACLGMVLAFGANREVFLRRLGTKGYTPELTEEISSVVADLVEHTFADRDAHSRQG